jgi:hypothetical protein
MDFLAFLLTSFMKGFASGIRRHCERSEAIQGTAGRLDCFVASAPRNNGNE